MGCIFPMKLCLSAFFALLFFSGVKGSTTATTTTTWTRTLQSSSSSSSSSSSVSAAVNLIISAATLLSSDSIHDCETPDDETCEEGMASVLAFARKNVPAGEPRMILQTADLTSQFVNMHPLKWNVNRLVIHELFGLDVFTAEPTILQQSKVDFQVSLLDLSEMQTTEMPLLLSNVNVPPGNSWHPYLRNIFFDTETSCAILIARQSSQRTSASLMESLPGALRYIRRLNEMNGCYSTTTTTAENSTTPTTVTISTTTLTNQSMLYSEYLKANEGRFDIFRNSSSSNNNNNEQQQQQTCWISVIYIQEFEDQFWALLQNITTSAFDVKPDLIVNIDSTYEIPLFSATPQNYNNSGVWVSHCGVDSSAYCQHRLTLEYPTTTVGNSNTDDATENATTRRRRLQMIRRRQQPRIQKVQLIQDDLENLSEDMKDEKWDQHIEFLHLLAEDAVANDPIVGETGLIPVVRDGSYRACTAGECAIGNLFADALRWTSGSTVAFTTSGGYYGPGKPAGPIRYSQLFEALPFSNTLCNGTMTGLSLFKLLNYSTTVATFQGEDTKYGGRLLQVSGMMVTYNTNLLNTSSRLVSVDVRNETTASYTPLDPLALYTFATDSYACGFYDPYPALTGANGGFVAEGEVPGRIGMTLLQTIVAEYLTNLAGTSYNTSVQGRLRNDTTAKVSMNVIQTESDCGPNWYYLKEAQHCFPCPKFSNVLFSDKLLEFEGRSHSTTENNTDTTQIPGRIVLVNRETFTTMVKPKSNPSWLHFVHINASVAIPLESGSSLPVDFYLDVLAETPGADSTTVGTVFFSIEEGGSHPGCRGMDTSFDAKLHVIPADNLNQLGSIRYAGIGLMAIVLFSAFFMMVWVHLNRDARVIKVMQPLFLLTVCGGVIILSAAIIPLSIDDGIVPVRGVDIACMCTPWLLSLGFTTAFAALFSKLWRINKLFNNTAPMRRITVKAEDVLVPFLVLFTLNLVLLMTWTFVDPLTYIRTSEEGRDWNSHGRCKAGTMSNVMAILLVILNVGALLLACYQAYRARNISDEFSESKYIGIAVYGWFQILLVAIPVIFLIGTANPTPRYFLTVSVIFVVGMSMLLIVFAPAYINRIKERKKKPAGNVHISGFNTSEGQLRSST